MRGLYYQKGIQSASEDIDMYGPVVNFEYVSQYSRFL